MPSQEFINKIKEQLLKEKKSLEKRLASFAHKNEQVSGDYDADFPQYGSDDDENVREVATYSDNLSLEHSLEKTLRDINKSLERIKQGTYGICKYCGQEIGEKRLEARPVSSACVACKEKLTQKIK